MIRNNLTDIIVVTWDGKSNFLFKNDELKNFDLLIFNYSGELGKKSILDSIKPEYYFSIKTEMKVQIFFELSRLLLNIKFRYIGIIDDDIDFKFSDINELLKIAEDNSLDTFQPSICKSSYYTYSQFIHKPDCKLEKVFWIEIMCPFYRKEIFQYGDFFYENNISSWGLDIYMFPYIQKILKYENTAIIHSVQVKHTRPITSGLKTYSNGLTAEHESEIIKKRYSNY